MTPKDYSDILTLWRRNLKKSLKKRGVSLGAASDGIGKNSEWLSRALRGVHDPGMDDILAVCMNHDIPFIELFSDDSHLAQSYSEAMLDSELTDELSLIARQITREPKKR